MRKLVERRRELDGGGVVHCLARPRVNLEVTLDRALASGPPCSTDSDPLGLMQQKPEVDVSVAYVRSTWRLETRLT